MHKAGLRILIAHSHEIVRVGLKAVLESHEGWQVVAEVEDGKDAISQALKVKPDVAIIDSSLPLIDGVEVTRQVRSRFPETEVLLFAAYENEALVKDAMLAGARAILLRSGPKDDLISAVTSLAAHRPFFICKMSKQFIQSLLSSKSPPPESGLSPRERTVVQLIADGHTNSQISQILNLSIKTIETHRAMAMRKLDISSTAGLVRYAVRNKLVDP